MIKRIRNLRTNRLKQRPIPSQCFTTESSKICLVSTDRPVNDKNGNLDNINMNTSTKNINVRDKSTDITPPKSHDNIGAIKGGKEKEEKMTAMLLSSVTKANQTKRFVKL